MPVQTGLNEVLTLKNAHSPCEVLPQRIDRKPANSNTYEHQSKSADRDEFSCVSHAAYWGKTRNDADHAEEMGEIPQFR